MSKPKRRKPRKPKRKERRRIVQIQLNRKRKRGLLERRRRRRKRDCMIGLPFIIGFAGDPAQLFYCADFPMSYELIPRTHRYPWDYETPFARLIRYTSHHITQIHDKVLIYKAK